MYGVVSIDYALRHSDRITGCSQAVIQSLDPLGKKLQGRSQVLYYGVNIPAPATLEDRTALRQAFGWSANTPLVLHVGRLVEQKNHSGLLSIFQHVLKHVPTAKLLLVGEGPKKSEIEALIAKLGISNAVYLLGFRDDVPSLMSKCDVFLFPSIHEGFGLVAIEANAAHLPIVGSRIPGLTEAVDDGKTALLHDVDDVEGMAKSVIELLQNKQYANQIGNAGLRWVEDHYSLKVGAEKLLGIYHEFATA